MCVANVLYMWQSQVESIGGVIDIQAAVTKVAVALKFIHEGTQKIWSDFQAF